MRVCASALIAGAIVMALQAQNIQSGPPTVRVFAGVGEFSSSPTTRMSLLTIDDGDGDGRLDRGFLLERSPGADEIKPFKSVVKGRHDTTEGLVVNLPDGRQLLLSIKPSTNISSQQVKVVGIVGVRPLRFNVENPRSHRELAAKFFAEFKTLPGGKPR